MRIEVSGFRSSTGWPKLRMRSPLAWTKKISDPRIDADHRPYALTTRQTRKAQRQCLSHRKSKRSWSRAFRGHRKRIRRNLYGRVYHSRCILPINHAEPKEAAMSTLKVSDCINETCPLSGKAVQADSLSLYKGRVVGFCNTGCRDKFETALSHFEKPRGANPQ